MDKSITTEAATRSCLFVRGIRLVDLAAAVAKVRSVLADYETTSNAACLLDERLAERPTIKCSRRASDCADIMEVIQ